MVWCRAFCSAGGTFCWTKLATTDFSSAVLTSANVTDVAGLNSDGITWVMILRWFLGYSKRTFWDICLSYSCDFSFDNIGWYSQKVPNPTLSFWINDSEAHSIHFYWPPLAQIAASTCCQGCIKAARSHKSIPEPRLSISVGRNRQRTPLRWVSNSGLTQSKRHQGGSQVVEGNPTFSVADAIHHHQKLLEMEIKTCHSIARLWNSEWSMSSLVELWWVDLVEMLPASPS